MTKKIRRCCLCGKIMAKSEGLGFSPEPIKSYSSGSCCIKCNKEKVIPAKNAERRAAAQDAAKEIEGE